MISRHVKTSGFSLVEILVAMGIISIIALAMNSMMTQSMKFQKGIMLTDELQNLTTSVKMILSKTPVCSHNIQFFSDNAKFDKTKLVTSSLTISKLSFLPPSNSVIIVGGGELPGQKNTAVNITMENIKEIIPGTEYAAELVFGLNKDAANSGIVAGVTHIKRSIPIKLTTVEIGNIQTIVSCATLEVATLTQTQVNSIKNEMCTSLAGTYTVDGSGVGHCVLAPPALPQASLMCASMGGFWNGSACNLPASASTIAEIASAATSASQAASTASAALNSALQAIAKASAPPSLPKPPPEFSCNDYSATVLLTSKE